MAGTDDSVANLQNFNATLTRTCSELEEQNSRLEAAENELDRLTSEAEEQVGAFNDDLEEAIQDVQQAQGDAEEAVGGVTEAATEIAQSGLAQAEDDLARAQGDFEGERAAGESLLEEGFSRLTEAGFQAFGATVDEVEGELQAVGQASQEDFDQLDHAVDEFQARVEGARTETVASLDEAQGGIEDESEQVEADFKDVTSNWDASIDEVLKSGCEEVGAALAQEYAEWGDAAGSVADSLGQALTDAVFGAAEFLGQDRAQAQENTLRETLNGPGDALLAEEGESVAALKEGEGVTGAIEPLVAELEVVLRVVDQVDQLLKAMD